MMGVNVFIRLESGSTPINKILELNTLLNRTTFSAIIVQDPCKIEKILFLFCRQFFISFYLPSCGFKNGFSIFY